MKHEYVQLQNDIKIIRTLKLFFYKIFFQYFFSLLSIPIVVMGINGFCFPTICRVCLENGDFVTTSGSLFLSGFRIRRWDDIRWRPIRQWSSQSQQQFVQPPSVRYQHQLPATCVNCIYRFLHQQPVWTNTPEYRKRGPWQRWRISVYHTPVSTPKISAIEWSKTPERD